MNGLQFDYTLGDVVNLSDGRLALIVAYGMYDNQYWCEVCYPDGVHLEGADWFSDCDNGTGDARIVGLAPDDREHVTRCAIEAIGEIVEKWPNIDFSERLNPILDASIRNEVA